MTSSLPPSYDFVVVGAGSTGALMASRLSEDGRFSVLVLEAGGWDRNLWIHVPIGFAKTLLNQRINWGYHTEPEEGLGGRKLYWPRGKVVGGSAAINGLIHIRGCREDFDGWRDAGCPGWGWSDVLPYFKRHEAHHQGANEWHGSQGPVSVIKPPDRSELCESVIAAGLQFGLPRNEDFSRGQHTGVGYYDLTVRKGRRSNTAIGALRAARRRSNLTVEVGAHVQRLVFDNHRVQAVEYRNRHGETVRVGVGREVVLCGGSINTPQLLMLSGIGPADHLKDKGIPVVQARAQVGQNLQDHMGIKMIFKTHRPVTFNDEMRNWWRTARVGLKYIFQRRGPLTYAAAQVGLFMRSDDQQPRPDAQILMTPYSTPGLGQPLHPFSAFTLSATQSWPSSRGSITLRDADPRSKPVIQAGYLGTPEDRAFFINIVRRLRQFVTTSPLDQLVGDEHQPGPAAQSDEAILDFVRATAGTLFHPCGTCRMGSDDEAVVDTALRLRGVAGVRIADASVMPLMPSGNINATCLMIAEKAAALILADQAA